MSLITFSDLYLYNSRVLVLLHHFQKKLGSNRRCIEAKKLISCNCIAVFSSRGGGGGGVY